MLLQGGTEAQGGEVAGHDSMFLTHKLHVVGTVGEGLALPRTKLLRHPFQPPDLSQ